MRPPVTLTPEARAEQVRAARDAEAAMVEAIGRRFEEAMAEREGRARFVPEGAFAEAVSIPEVDRMARAIVGGMESGAAPGWFVTGGFGTGKTTVAQAVMRLWTEGGRGGLMVSEVDYLRELRDSFDEPGETARLTRRVVEAPLLVVDDMGKSAPAPWKAEELFRVVDARWRGRMPTVVTSNMTPQQLGALWGGTSAALAVASRLSAFRSVGTGAKDHRGR